MGILGRNKLVGTLTWETSHDGAQFTAYAGNTKAMVLRSMFDESYVAYMETIKSLVATESYYLGNFVDMESAKEACEDFVRTGGKFGKAAGLGGE